MKIVLVCPKYSFQGYTPTGLASIASVAEQLGHKVEILDLNIESSWTGVSLKYYLSGFADIIGVTGLSLWKKSIIEVSKKFAGKPIIVGGAWASLYPQEVLSNSQISYVCMGEGEITFKEFLQNYPNVEDVEGLGYLQDGEFKGSYRPFISDLDSLPLPAWHLIRLYEYKRVSIFTSRGCPFNCIFCSDHTLNGYKWRFKSPEVVVKEIQLLVNHYGVKHITFGDENMTLIPERFERICEMIIENNVKCSFDAVQGIRADRLNPRLLTRMKQAGFTEITVAPESGSQRVLDEVIHKNLDLSKVEEVVKECKKIGLTCSAFFVIGFPWETKEEIQQTIKYADYLRSIGLASAFIGNALPFPDTELYRKAKEEGFLRFDGEELEQILYYLGKPRTVHCLTSPYWKPEEIIKICEKETKKNLRHSYKNYSLSDVITKSIRHPVRAFKKLRRVI